jgi:hypothetical protein
MAARVSIDDLRFAETWLLAYEGEAGDTVGTDPDQDEQTRTLARVAAWVAAEVERREEETSCRAVAKQLGLRVTDPRVRAAVRRVRAKAAS